MLQSLKDAITHIETKTSVTRVWFCMFLGQKLYQCCKFSIGLNVNVTNILWEYVKQFGLDIMRIEYSKALIKHYNE
jgi:hypothetical protein